MKRKKMIPLFILFLSYQVCFAQETTLSSGADISGNGGSASYSIGQVVYTSNTDNSGSNLQGVQQAYEIYTITSIKDIDLLAIELDIYPNPTSNFLNLKIDNKENQELEYLLYDLNGKLLTTSKITEPSTLIDLQNLAASNYFLTIESLKTPIQTFKIIKN